MNLKYNFGIAFIATVGLIAVVVFNGPLVLNNASGAEQPTEIVIKRHNISKVSKVTFSTQREAQEVLEWLQKEPCVDIASQNFSYAMAIEPDDKYYSSQWYLDHIGAPAAWDTTTGDSEVVIAILDSGVDTDHPDLLGNLWINVDETQNNGIDDDQNGFVDDYYGWDFVGNSADPNPKYDSGWTEAGINHGTTIAGVAGAVGNNSIGIAGINWDVKIMAIRVLDGTGLGDTQAVYQGIQYAVENGADFINLSFVGSDYDTLLASAIQSAALQDVIVFAAAGNDSVDLNTSQRYPVCNAHVVGVGGTNQNDIRLILQNGSDVTGGSNYGSDCVDLSAPASGFLGTVVYDPSQGLEDYYLAGWSGTSVATPVVSGTAALLKAKDSTLTADQIIELLIDSVSPITYADSSLEGSLGSGRLDLTSIMEEETPVEYKIIAGAGNGGGPHVRIFDQQGNLQTQFFAFAESFRGGVNVASGDVDGDSTDEIIVGAGNGGGPHVRIFDQQGNLQTQFFAYAESFRGGVNVAVGDVNGDGVGDIIAGAGYSGGPHVRVFSKYGTRYSQFFAYAESFRGGVNVASGDVDGDGTDEIIAGAGSGGGPHIRVFDYQGNLQNQFFAYAESFRGGVNVESIR